MKASLMPRDLMMTSKGEDFKRNGKGDEDVRRPLYENVYEFLIAVGLVLMLVAVGLGIEWCVYDTGRLKEHMTFLEWLLIRK